MKFKGRSSTKQYQPLKLIKRGFKVWCRAGYVSNFVVYTGKADGPVKNLGNKIVMEICRDILNKGHEVYFDNYSPLLNWLLTYSSMGPLVLQQPDLIE